MEKQLATDRSETTEGYGLQGHFFAIGYLRGLERATAPLAGKRG